MQVQHASRNMQSVGMCERALCGESVVLVFIVRKFPPPLESEMTRIAVFADVQNIYYTTRQAFGRQFNYRALWETLSQQGDIVVALAYATERGDDGQTRFQDALRHLGFTVKLKPYIQRSDGSTKGDWDVGIAVDVMTHAPQVDTVVLLSGDGDFDVLLSAINENPGVRTEVYGVESLTARSLIESAAQYHAIGKDLLL